MRPLLPACLPALAALLLGALPASGQQTGAEEGEALRSAIERSIQRAFGPLQDNEFLEWSGEVGLEIEDDRYVLTVPRIVLGIDTDHLAVPETEIVMVPVGDGLFDARMALPREFEARIEGVERIRLTVGRTTGRGVYDLAYGTFVELDLRLLDVYAGVTEERAPDVEQSARMDEIAFSEIFVREEGNLFSGSAVYEILGFSASTRDGEDLTFDRLAYEAAFQRVDLRRLEVFNAWILGLDADHGPVGRHWLPESVRRAILDYAEDFEPFVDGVGARYVLEGLSVPSLDLRRLDSLFFGAKATGLAGRRASLEIEAGHEGLDLAGGATVRRYVPTESRFSMTIDDLPTGELLQVALDVVAADPFLATSDEALAAWGERLMGAFAEAGTTLRIDRFHLSGEALLLDLSGLVRPDDRSGYGIVSDARLEVAGLEEFSLFLGLLTGFRDAPVINSLFELSEPLIGADGLRRRVFRLELRQDGTILVNGEDVTDMIEGVR